MGRNVSGFLNSFAAGYNLADGIKTQNRKHAQEDELEAVATDKPVTDDRYTPEQGAALESAANSGAAITYDEGSKSYVVTPTDGAANPVAPVKHTSYQGQTVAGEMAPEQMTAARRAAQAGVLEKYGDIDSADRMRRSDAQDKLNSVQLENSQTQLSNTKRGAARQAVIAQADAVARNWAEKNVKRDAEGQPILDAGTLIHFSKLRSMALAEHGVFDEASKTAAEGFKLAKSKIEAETDERKAAIDDAVSAVGFGNYKKAGAVYRRYAPDGADDVDIQPGKDGTIVMSRVSSLDGAKLAPITFKSQEHFLSSLQGMADSKALTKYIETSFKHDLDARRLSLEGARVDIARQSAANRGQGGITAAQDRSNKEIDAARDSVSDLSDEDIRQRTAPTTATGRENPLFDPALSRAAKLAGRRKIGEDETFDTRAGKQPSVSAQSQEKGTPKVRAAAAMAADPAMNGFTLGDQTGAGFKVFDAKGKHIGFYGAAR